MIEIDKMIAAYHDITNASDDGLDMNDIIMRFEMLDADFDDFRMFMTYRLKALDHLEDQNDPWARGYIHAAMEFFLYGILAGKEEALDIEIDVFER